MQSDWRLSDGGTDTGASAMDLLIIVLVVLVILALALFATQKLGAALSLEGNIVLLIQVVLIVVAILVIVRQAGLA